MLFDYLNGTNFRGFRGFGPKREIKFPFFTPGMAEPRKLIAAKFCWKLFNRKIFLKLVTEKFLGQKVSSFQNLRSFSIRLISQKYYFLLKLLQKRQKSTVARASTAKISSREILVQDPTAKISSREMPQKNRPRKLVPAKISSLKVFGPPGSKGVNNRLFGARACAYPRS